MLFTMNRVKREEDQSNNSVLNQFKTKYIGLKNSVDELYNLVLWLMNWANDLADRLSKIRTDMYEDLWDVQDDARDGKIKDTFTFSQIKDLIDNAENDLSNITGELEDVLGCLHACQTCDTACDALVAGPNGNFCSTYDGNETCFSLSACSYNTPVCNDSDEPPCDYIDEPVCNDTVDCNENDTITVIVPCDNNKTCPSCYGSTVTTETETKVTCTSCDAGNCTGNCVDEVGCDQSLSGVINDLSEFGEGDQNESCNFVNNDFYFSVCKILNTTSFIDCQVSVGTTDKCTTGPYVEWTEGVVQSVRLYLVKKCETSSDDSAPTIVDCPTGKIGMTDMCIHVDDKQTFDVGNPTVRIKNFGTYNCNGSVTISDAENDCMVEGSTTEVTHGTTVYTCDASISYRIDMDGNIHIVADNCEPSYTQPTTSCDNPATEHTEETTTTEKQVCTGGASLDSVDYTEGEDTTISYSASDLIELCDQRAEANECNPEFTSCNNILALQDKCSQAACSQGAGSAGCGGEVACSYSPCGCYGYSAPCSQCPLCYVSGGGSYGTCNSYGSCTGDVGICIEHESCGEGSGGCVTTGL